MYARDITSSQLSSYLKVGVEICQAFLDEVQQRTPTATIRFNATAADITMPGTNVPALHLSRYDGFVVVQVGPKMLIPQESITDGPAARAFASRNDAFITPKKQLATRIMARMAGTYGEQYRRRSVLRRLGLRNR